MPKVKIAPSILSADFSRINEEIKTVERYSDMLHVDIMDGKFVPQTTIDVRDVRKIVTRLPLDVHLMVKEPGHYFLRRCIDTGVSSITIHEEACSDPLKQIHYIKGRGVSACISIKPNTPMDNIKKYLGAVDMVLIMTVEPGWAGQEFIESAMSKVRELRQMKPQLDIEVDGGINPRTAKIAHEAGANVFVAGSFIFGRKDRKNAIRELLSGLKEDH